MADQKWIKDCRLHQSPATWTTQHCVGAVEAAAVVVPQGVEEGVQAHLESSEAREQVSEPCVEAPTPAPCSQC